MNILVTGGCGYIGSHTVIELLQNKHNPIIIDDLSNSNYDVIDKIYAITGKTPIFYNGNVNDKKFLSCIFKNHSINVVIHFAGLKCVNESVANPLTYYNTNIGMTFTLLDVMQKYNVHNIIFSSSATVYGSSTSPVSENSVTGLNITNPYGKTKFMIEEILKDLYASNNKWTIILLRYFNPVGAHCSGLICENPKNSPNNLMPVIMNCVKKKSKLSIYGSDYNTLDGTCIRDFIHVVDLAKGHTACLKLIDNFKLNIFNLGTGVGTSVKTLVETFIKANNVHLIYQFIDRRAGDIETSFADNSKSFAVLNWKPIYNIRDMCIDSWKSVVLQK